MTTGGTDIAEFAIIAEKHDTVPIGVMVKKALFLKKFREQLLYILTKSYSDNFGDISVLISCSL